MKLSHINLNRLLTFDHNTSGNPLLFYIQNENSNLLKLHQSCQERVPTRGMLFRIVFKRLPPLWVGMCRRFDRPLLESGKVRICCLDFSKLWDSKARVFFCFTFFHSLQSWWINLELAILIACCYSDAFKLIMRFNACWKIDEVETRLHF